MTRCSEKPILCYPFDRDLSSEYHYQPFEQPGLGTWTHEKLFAHNNVNNLIFTGKAALTYNMALLYFFDENVNAMSAFSKISIVP